MPTRERELKYGSSRATVPGASTKLLYLSFDGMTDPLGASQVLPYLVGLAKLGHRIHIISLEKPERSLAERAEIARITAEAQIKWHPLPYHKRPPLLASLYDLTRMQRLAERLHANDRFDLVHCRSYLPALVALRLKRRFGVPFIFDMRGFWPDERLEGGAWNQSNPVFRAVYSYFKNKERSFLKEADEIVSLTQKGARTIRSAHSAGLLRAPISIIPCCVDFELFSGANGEKKKAARDLLNIGRETRVLGYLGSLGGNYMLGEMLDFFAAYRARFDGAKFLLVTLASEDQIRSEAQRRSIPDEAILVRRAKRKEVPLLMAAADEGIAFKQPSFSARACSPTKIGEMLALDLPVVANRGVGDIEQVIEQTGGGVLVNSFNDQSYRAALDALDQLDADMDRWHQAARTWFDLKTGIERYNAIYVKYAERSDG